MRNKTTLIVLTAVATLALASCGAAEQGAEADARLNVVASTTVYADLAKQIGGAEIDTTAIITRTSQDPHSYEATPRDKLAVSKADLVIENGGGYDSFMEPLIESTGQGTDHVISVVDLDPALKLAETAGSEKETPEEAHEHDHAGHDHAHGGFNEHLWYDLPTMRALIVKVADSLSAADPAHAGEFAANAKKIDTELGALQDRVTTLGQRTQGLAFAATEPVPSYLLTGAGLTDATPDGFGEAVESGQDVPPLVLKEFKTELEHGHINVLAYNTQTASDQTDAIAEQAKAQGVPVVDFTETLPEGLDFQTWMDQNIKALEETPGLRAR